MSISPSSGFLRFHTIALARPSWSSAHKWICEKTATPSRSWQRTSSALYIPTAERSWPMCSRLLNMSSAPLWHRCVRRFKSLIALLQWKSVVVLAVVGNGILNCSIPFLFCPFSPAGAEECVWRGHPGGLGASWDKREAKVCPAIEEQGQWEIWWCMKQVGWIVALIAGHYDWKGEAIGGGEAQCRWDSSSSSRGVLWLCLQNKLWKKLSKQKKIQHAVKCGKRHDSPFSESFWNCSVFSTSFRWGGPPCLSLSLHYKQKNQQKLYSITWY